MFIAGALPGEQVRATMAGAKRATLDAVLDPSPDRVQPPCPHFGICGGCAVQHWRDDRYIGWKSDQLAAALSRAGYDAELQPPARTPPHARRRMDLALRRQGRTVLVGLHASHSGNIVDLATCVVLDPALVALIEPLRALLPRLLGLRREGSAIVNLLDTGPDLLLRGDGELTAADRTLLAAFAASQGIPRISWARGTGEAEPAALLRTPSSTLGGVAVTPAPGAFLQASAAGEAAIVASVLAGLPAKLTAKPRIADLYAGIGTLTFPLASRARVDAFEGDAAAVATLRAGGAKLSGRIMAERRDLARQPLSAREVASYAAVVLDPPHAGAAAQIAEIARAGVSRVIYVSCNPATLGRDATALHDAGYRLVSATPIDQFLWSARIESVSVFERLA